MDELYTESFFTSSGTIVKKENPRPLIHEPLQEVKRDKASKPVVQPPVEKPSLETYETANQMSFYLDQLEKALFQEFSNSSDFRFIVGKIKNKLKDKKTEGIFELLTELEELMELS